MSSASDFHTSERAQLSSSHARVVSMFLIGLAVIGLVGREIVATQRDRLAACAPDCQLGAPLAIGPVDAALVAIPLLGIGLLSWVLFASGVVPRRIGGERDE